MDRESRHSVAVLHCFAMIGILLLLPGGPLQSEEMAPGGDIHALAEPELRSWANERQMNQHLASLNESPRLPLDVDWITQVQPAAPIETTPIRHQRIDLVYVGSNAGRVYALDVTTGATTWAHETQGDVSASPCVLVHKGDWYFEDYGYLFATSEDGGLYSLDPYTGQRRWMHKLKKPHPDDTPMISAPMVAGETEIVYYLAREIKTGSWLMAVNADDGTELFRKCLDLISASTPMEVFGTIYVGISYDWSSGDSLIFYGFDGISGRAVWAVYDQDPLSGCYTSGVPNLDAAGSNPDSYPIYIGTRSGFVKAIQSDSGDGLWWTRLPNDGPVTGMALTQGRTPNTLVVSQDAHLHALRPSSPDRVLFEVLWSREFDENLRTEDNYRTPEPAIWGDYVFHVFDANRVVALSLEDGTEQWSYRLRATTVSSPAIDGQALYIADNGGHVYRFVPHTEHDVAVKDLTDLSGEVFYPGDLVPIEATVCNEGDFRERFDVVLYVNGVAEAVEPGVALNVGECKVVLLVWDTTGLSPGEYVVKVCADQVPKETNIGDNCRQTTGEVRVRKLTLSTTDYGSVTMPCGNTELTVRGEETCEYPDGHEVRLQAIADACYEFLGWTGTAVDAGKVDPMALELALVMDSDYTLKANFAKIQYALTVTCSGSSSIEVIVANGAAEIVQPCETRVFQIDCGDEVCARAIARNEYCQVIAWTGSFASSEVSLCFVMDADYTLSAQVECEQHVVDISAGDGGQVRISDVTCDLAQGWEGENWVLSFDHGTKLVVVAEPYSGYVFKGWSGTVGSSQAKLDFVVDQDYVLIAEFEVEP